MSDNVINMNNYVRAKFVMDMYGIARSTVDKWAKEGRMKRHKVGKGVFYNKAEILRIIP